MTKATLFAILAPLFTVGFRALLRRLERGNHRARRAYVLVNLVVAVVVLAVYAVGFRNLTFPPPSVLHGLGLLFVLSLPIGLVVLCVMELREMRGEPSEPS